MAIGINPPNIPYPRHNLENALEAVVVHKIMEKRPVGRPAGPVDPEKLHETELTRWVKVNARIRELVERQLKYLEKKIENAGEGLVLKDQLDIMAGLGSLLQVSSKTVESGLKALDHGKTNEPTEDIKDILDGLSGGQSG